MDINGWTAIMALATVGMAITTYLSILQNRKYYEISADNSEGTTQLEAYYQAVEHITELKTNLIEYPEVMKEVLSREPVYKIAIGIREQDKIEQDCVKHNDPLSAQSFMVVCKAFYHLEHIYLLNRHHFFADRGDCSNEENHYYGLRRSIEEFLDLSAFESVYWNYILVSKTHDKRFLTALTQFYGDGDNLRNKETTELYKTYVSTRSIDAVDVK